MKLKRILTNLIHKRLLSSILGHIAEFKTLFYVNSVVVFLAAIFEGFGLGLLVPVLQSIEGISAGNKFVEYVGKFCGLLGIEYKFVNLIGIFAFVMILKYFLVMLQQHLNRVLSSRLTESLRNKCFDNLMRVSLSYYYNCRIGELISTIFNSTKNAGAVVEYFLLFLKGVVFAITYLVLAAGLSFKLTASVMVVVGISYAFIWPRFKKGNVYGEKDKELTSEIMGLLQDRLGGIKIIKSFNAEQRLSIEASSLFSRYQRNEVDTMNNKIMAFAFFEPFLFLVLVALLIVAVEYFKLPMVNLIVTMLIFTQIIPQFKSINTNLIMINDLIPHLDKVDELISDADKPYLTEGKRNIEELNRAIELKDVTFRYAENLKHVLNGISIEIPIHRTTAFVGMSGGGKSTLINLLLRHHDPVQGVITADGIDIREVENRCWKSRVALVDQDNYLFHDSIYNNILYGNPYASMEDVHQAAQSAYAHEFIMNMKEGYHTIIGNRGFRLSGGQRQRIALARALVGRPQILILDEATSALDSESESFIQRTLQELQGKITIIIIAHRLSTIKNADKIIVLEHGLAKEQGSHDDLMRLSGQYRHYVTLQSGQSGIPEVAKEKIKTDA